jgi:hypothetical protein
LPRHGLRNQLSVQVHPIWGRGWYPVRCLIPGFRLLLLAIYLIFTGFYDCYTRIFILLITSCVRLDISATAVFGSGDDELIPICTDTISGDPDTTPLPETAMICGSDDDPENNNDTNNAPTSRQMITIWKSRSSIHIVR